MRAGILIVDIAANVARLAADMASAKGIVASSMNEISRAANVAKTALGALGVGLSVGALTSMAAGIVKATAALDDMAEVTGTTVENLSRFSVVAKIGSHDMGMVEDSLVKLTKGLKGTEEETKNVSAALGFLGVQAKDSAGKLRDPGEIMREVAVRLSQFEDGAGKTALALDLFGKSGAKLLPFLKDMAEEGSVAARVTAQQAAEAEKLEKNLNRLRIVGEDSKREFMMGLTPALADFTERLMLAQRATGNLVAALVMLGGTDISNVGEKLKETERQLARREASIKFTDSWGALGLSAVTKVGAGVFRQRRNYLLGVQRQQALAGAGPGDWDTRDIRVNTRMPMSYAGAGEKDKKTGRTAADVLNEAAGVSKDFFKDLQLLHAEYARGRMSLEQYQETVGKLIEKQAFAKEAAKQQQEVQQALFSAATAALKLDEERIKVVEQTTLALISRSAEIDREAGLIGASAAEREKSNEFLSIENTLRKASIDLTPEQIASLRALADAEKVRIGAAIDAKVAKEKAHEASTASAKEWKDSYDRMSQDIERALTDSLMRGGKSALEYIEDIFRTAVLQPILRPIAQGITGMVQGAFGMGGSGSGGGGGFNMPSFGGGGFFDANSVIGSSIANFGGGTMLAGGAAGTALAAEASALGIAQIGGAGAGALGAIGTALPWVGGALAVGSMLGLFDDDDGVRQVRGSKLGVFGGPGGYSLGQNDMPMGPGFMDDVTRDPRFAALNAALNDPKQFDQGMLSGMTGYLEGSVNQPMSSMLDVLIQRLAPAAQVAQQALAVEQEQLKTQQALLAAQPQLEASLANAVRALPQSLGISTLEAARMGLATSESVAPLDRFAAARGYLDESYGRAMGGDLSAVQSFPELLQSTLGIGRDVFASGPQFAELFIGGNRMLNDLLARQNEIQAEMTASVPMTIKEAAADQITELRRGFSAMVNALAENNSRLREIELALAP